MPTSVTIDIVGRTYEVNCDEGQEAYLLNLGAGVNRRAAELMRAVGQVGDARLLVMVALSMADEMAELRRGGNAATSPAPELNHEIDAALAQSLESLIHRIDSIAARLEKA